MFFMFMFFFLVLFGFFDLFFVFCFIFVLSFYLLFFYGGFYMSSFFFMDSISFYLMILSFFVYFFCFMANFTDKWSNNMFFSYIFYLSFIFFLLFLCFSCLNVFLFYFCFEFIFLLMFLFLLSWGYSPERLQASFYMVFYTIVVSFPFLVFLVFFGLGFNTSSFLFVNFFVKFWWAFLFLVFLVKLPAYGVHLWLPKAHVEAPVSGSMLLAGVLLKLGGYGFLRFSVFFFCFLSKFSGYFISIGLTGGLISCFICLRQVDLKSFIAYSSICHMGFGLSGLYSYLYFGYVGFVFMMVAHGFCSSCLFYIMYVLYKRLYSRSFLLLKGSIYFFPVLGFISFLFFSFNMGVPPSFSFFSEVFILLSLGYTLLQNLFFCMIFLFFAGVYCIYLYIISNHGIGVIFNFSFLVFIREYLVFFGHLFPMLFFSVLVSFFI